MTPSAADHVSPTTGRVFANHAVRAVRVAAVVLVFALLTPSRASAQQSADTEAEAEAGAGQSPSAESLKTLGEQLRRGSATERREASHRLREFGALAAPAVPDLIAALDDDEQQVWFNSVMTLAAIGPKAEPAIPSLIADLDQSRRGRRNRYWEQVWYRSAYALSQIGPGALPALLTALENPSSDVRSGAARAIGWMRPRESTTIGSLTRLLDDPDEKVRNIAGEALAEIGPASVPDLRAALESESSRMVIGAVRALGSIQSDAAPAAPRVALLFRESTEPTLRAEALNAVVRMTSDPAIVLPLLLEGLKADDDAIIQSAASGLLRLRSHSAAIVPSLIEMLDSSSPDVATRAADVLGRFGPRSNAAVPDLIRLAGANQDEEAAATARQALVRIGPASVAPLLDWAAELGVDGVDGQDWPVLALSQIGTPAVPDLARALEISDSAAVKLVSTRAIGKVGSDAASAVPLLFGLLNDSEPRVRAAALDALVMVGADFDLLLPRVKTALEDSAPEPRLAAGRAASAMGAAAASLVDPLMVSLDADDPAFQATAAAALGGLGPLARPALPRLTNLLATDNEALRVAVIRCLGAIGPEANASAPQLISLGRSESVKERAAVVQALVQLEPPRDSVRELLESLRADSDPEVRALAIQASVRLDGDNPNLSPMLVEAMKDESASVRQAAARSVPLLDGKDDRVSAEPGLFGLLDSNESEDRDLALDLLRQLQPEDVSRLVRALENKSPAVRLFACERLGRIGSAAREAIPALRRLEDDNYDFIRREARDAVRRIERRR